MAAATPPSPVDWTWPARPPTLTSTRSSSPPLELQLLPPAPFTASSESRWGLDASRLQQLMMGSAPGTSTLLNAAPSACSSVRDLGVLFDDTGASKPLPSGWERCLDLQSGEMFLKKCDAAAKGLPTSCSPRLEQGKDWKQSGIETSRWPEAFSATDEHRQDWSCRWQADMSLTSQHEAIHAQKSFVGASAMLGRDKDTPSLPDREPLGLDLDLRLTNEKRGKVAQDVTCMRPSNGIAHGRASNQSCVQELIQPWKWQQCANGSEKPASIQEMARESTMVTAVCSKCLMYVLLRKSSPICPRCSVPIILDGALAASASKKRPRLELSPDVLSLSTDSSR